MTNLINSGISVPDNVSITGFDNLFLSSSMIPAVTTVINPIEQMGKRALELSIALKNGDHSFKLGSCETKLVCRYSVKKLK